MATQLQIRRGTSSQVAAFTGAEGEIVVNTTNDSVHVNDGSTAGGFEQARADLNNVSDASLNAALTGNTVSALTITTLTLGSTAITATGAEINILDGVTATAAELNILDGVTSTAAELNILDGVTATTGELNYVDGVTSAIQTQLDAKAPLASPTFTGTLTATEASVAEFSTSTNVFESNVSGQKGARLRAAVSDAGTPTFSFHDDTNTGMFSSGADTLNFSTAGSERVRITSTGVGIGTTTVNADLHLGAASPHIDIGPSTGNRAKVGFDTNNVYIGTTSGIGEIHFKNNIGSTDAPHSSGDTKMVIADSGVGIAGASSPNALLHVGGTAETQGSQANPAIQIGSTTGYRLGMYTDAEGGYIENKNGDNGLIFRVKTKGEAMRIDGGTGNLLVGKSSTSISDAGHTIFASGEVFHTVAGTPLYVNRTGSDGPIQNFYRDGSIFGSIHVQQSSLSIGGSSTGAIYFNAGTDVRPWNKTANTNADNTLNLGSVNSRWEEFFCANATINTSDRNEKQDIEELSDAEKRVAVAAKGLLRKYRWKDAVAEKGDDARIHFGIIAQDLQDAFTAEGLDAARYAMFCSDTWTNDDGSEQTRLGVRYSELLAFIISAI